MKSNFTSSVVLAFVLGVTTLSQGQTTWQLTGNSISSGQYLGTTNAFPLQLRTTQPQPILFQTGNASNVATHRMKLNGDVNYDINGIGSSARNGYLLLGINTNLSYDGTPIYNTGAFSMLHLNGGSGNVSKYGYRNWMRTGMTLTDNADMSYIGLRKIGSSSDLTETVLAWTNDNANNPTYGPDDLVFRFLSGDDNTTTTVIDTANLSSLWDLDGLHVARFTSSGKIGFGNTFGLAADYANYAYPKNLLHMSLDQNKAVFLQITNQSGTLQTDTDGLHIGIPATTSTNL